jgi:hypothetical protein
MSDVQLNSSMVLSGDEAASDGAVEKQTKKGINVWILNEEIIAFHSHWLGQ